jgi:hypothetical protein
MTKDHIVPRSQGGTLHTDNLQPLCGHCNRDKGDLVIDYRPLALAHMGSLTPTQRMRAGRDIESEIASDPALWVGPSRPPNKRRCSPTVRQQHRNRNTEAKLREFLAAYEPAERGNA